MAKLLKIPHHIKVSWSPGRPKSWYHIWSRSLWSRPHWTSPYSPDHKWSQNNLKIHAPRALGRRKTALGVPQSPTTRHTMYAVILHDLGHIIILFIMCARTHWIALNWHSIYTLTNRAHPPKNVAPPPSAAHAPAGGIIPMSASQPFQHFCKLELIIWEKFKQ